MNEVRKLLESRFPGLHARIEQTLVEAEARYNRQTRQAPSEFLLEHSQRTAAIAHKLAAREGVNSFLPVLVALYHDAGKFHEGEYHKDDVPAMVEIGAGFSGPVRFEPSLQEFHNRLGDGFLGARLEAQRDLGTLDGCFQQIGKFHLAPAFNPVAA